MSTVFSDLSKQLTSVLTKTEKKNGGIFFTPPLCVQYIISILHKHIQDFPITINNILEPSCGSGEFITALLKEYPNADITGIEYHDGIYKEVSKHFTKETNSRVKIVHNDFLKYPDKCSSSSCNIPAPELIIGNPPYFVMKKEEVDSEYYPYFDGRPNVFIMFIIKSAKLLSDGGIMCFVLPSSFMNSQYYDKTRKYIVNQFNIVHIGRCDISNGKGKYIDTEQDTIILILKKKKTDEMVSLTKTTKTTKTKTTVIGNGGIYEKSGATIFTDNLPELSRLYKNSQSLFELGFKVSVGTVVWNQCKNILTDDESKTRLIYSSNIENGEFIHKNYKNVEKKAFIDKKGVRTPMIVLNRGYGVGEYQFDYCLLTPEKITEKGEYLIENHLICITHKSENISEFQKIINSFKDKRTQEFISCYFGNNAINTTELNHMLPIYSE